ncbi:hypothetical protein P7C73_g5855, partial [Tremellales sp. Uapishka_1]
MSRSISLSPAETTFCGLLDDFARKQVPPVECRIAGGWVRDKLLSLPSADLDIALSISSGHTFAVDFVDYLKQLSPTITVGSVGKVAANPDQSKHLETGTTRIMGLECDFVGLRSETYADSRIPDQVQLGTPLEDASRRDLTINSLFYNVHTREVEDFTEKGLIDLDHKVARTPLPPRQTFHDDPLRILRCVRFSARFGLDIAQEVQDAIMQDDVKEALKDKVSKERIGIEITKSMKHDPFKAISLIHNLNLHSSIFTCPPTTTPIYPTDDTIKTAEILRAVLQRLCEEGNEFLWLACAMAPFRDAVVVGRNKKELPAVSVVLAEGMKLSTEYKNTVTNLFAASRLLDPKLEGRSTIGLVLQNAAVKPWEQSVIWSIVMAILPGWKGEWDAQSEASLVDYKAFIQNIHDYGLPLSISQPPLIDGTGVQSILSIPPSRLVQVILQAVNVWHLDNPGKTREEGENWLKETWNGEGRAEWERQLPVEAPKAKKAKVEKAKADERKR